MISRHDTDEALSEKLLIVRNGDYRAAITALEEYRTHRSLDPETTSSLDRMLATWQSLAKDTKPNHDGLAHGPLFSGKPSEGGSDETRSTAQFHEN